ncbi:MAG TPA: glycoside hydrolase family 38 C-terminal domain-containing protein, partial [Solirubrobacteraceae bacterium]
LLGRIVCERFGVQPSPVGYLPDSFGHPLQVPQILAGFGIDNMIFSRGLGDELDEIGVVFRWRSPDGSEVRAIQQLPSYSNFAHVGDADDAQARIAAIAERFSGALTQAGVHELLLCAGDDHVRIRRDLPALCTELERRLPGTEVTIARYSDFVDALDPGPLPVWSGELLGSRLQNVLRGVNSARLYLKRANARAESRLLGVETLGALRSLRTGQRFPVADFRLAWSRLLRCQPHDSICGCSCDEVHRDMLVRYELLERTITVLARRALAALQTETHDTDRVAARVGVGVVNVLPERRRGLIEVAGMEPVVVELDGFSARTVELAPADPESHDPPDGGAIENERFRVEAGDDGTLTVIDKHTGRRFDQLHRLEDELDTGDLYNFCPIEGVPPWRCDRAEARVLRAGPTVRELELRFVTERPAGLDGELRPEAELRPLTVTTVVRLVEGLGRIEFRTTLENATRDHRLRVVFPVPGAPSEARAEGQFALVNRPLETPAPRTQWVEPPDPTQHTLGAVALGPLALLTNGLPEYEARTAPDGNELCLTLLRAVGLISRPSGAIATRPLSAGPQLATPEGQCLGTHELEYALLTDADGLDAVALLRASQDYRLGFLVDPHDDGAHLDSPVSVEGDVVFSCLKGAEDGNGLIMRCFNPADAAASVRITGPVTVSRVRLDETKDDVVREPTRDGTFALGGGQIGTFRLLPAP